ncbi:hypothetical protein PTKIN_Ptkin07bG0264600 [Pterospermum kingtungense]
MAHLPLSRKMKFLRLIIMQVKMMETMIYLMLFLVAAIHIRKRKNRRRISYANKTFERHCIRSLNSYKMVFESDTQSLDNCRMDRRTFGKLCQLLKTMGELKESNNMTIEEKVANFLHIIAHHTKNRVIKRQVARSGETISRQFHAVLRLHPLLFKKPVSIGENSTDNRWRWFKVV